MNAGDTKPPLLSEDAWLECLLDQALLEDVGGGDVSTSLAVPPDRLARARLVARAEGVLAGVPLLARIYARLDDGVRVTPVRTDGAAVRPGDLVAEIGGPAGPILTGERMALNFLQHLSGIATLTARYVAAAAGTGCAVLDTRKTVPGYRHLAKYAVCCGGGRNHRLGLYDRVMFKDNHWIAAGRDIDVLVRAARQRYPVLDVEVEVDTLDQLARVLPLQVEWVLLDNFTPEQAATAVAMRARLGVHGTRLEASGNVDLASVRAYAEAGVDAVSVGRLTHSAPALDLGLDLELEPAGDRDTGRSPG
ncbi:MAG: carboxylating nicotinate-nucleotide diphosphorylase [Candidatus Krumholzibacteriia bacterium]